MKNAFIFHGTAGHPEENWFPWLKAELDERSLMTIVPQFPTPENQTLANWLHVMEPHFPLLDQNAILIGHSLGGIFALRVLEQLSTPIRAAFFVGTPIGIGEVQNKDSDALFSQKPLHWDKIRAHAKDFFVYQSDDDPYVPLENGTVLAEHLGVKLNFISGCGHFNAASGFLKFPQLLADILSLNAAPR